MNVITGHIMRRETEKSCDNRNDQKKTQQGKTVRKDLRWADKLSVGQVKDALKAKRDQATWKVMITNATK